MIALEKVRKSQLNLASHYARLVCRCNADYISGFERSVQAIAVFDRERLQIENTVAWLMREADDDEAGALLVTLLRDGGQLLYTCIDAAELHTWLERGLTVAQRFGDVRSQAAQLLLLGFVAWRTTNTAPSRPFFEQASALAQQTDDQHLLVRCLLALVNVYETEKDYDAAARYNQQAYELSLRLRYTPGLYIYFDHEGTKLYEEGRFEEALTALNQSYALALKSGQYREIALTLSMIGNIYYFQERFDDAIAILRQALEFSTPTGFPPVILYTLHALGNAQAAAGDSAAAQENFLSALRLAEHHHFDEQAGVMRGELGTLAFQQHDLRLARDFLEEALHQLRSVESMFFYPTFLIQLVPVYLGLGEVASAERALREGLDFAVQTADSQHSLDVIWGAAQLWIHRAGRDDLTPQARSEWAEMGARWAGAVLASPNLAPNNRKTLRSLIPALYGALGADRTNELLDAGAQLDPAALIDDLRAALAA